jgi:putative ABC transport system permease protein
MSLAVGCFAGYTADIRHIDSHARSGEPIWRASRTRCVDDIVVDVTSASREHRTKTTRVIALDAVSLRLAAGKAVAVVGPSGAGKTTLLNLISGLDRPTNGQVSVLGHDLGGMSERLLTKFRASSVGMVFQDSYLLPGLTALENVTAAGTRWRNRRQVVDEASTLLEAVGLADRMDFPPSRLSGGERQRVGIARAMLGNRPLLVADEPTGTWTHARLWSCSTSSWSFASPETLRSCSRPTIRSLPTDCRAGWSCDRAGWHRDPAGRARDPGPTSALGHRGGRTLHRPGWLCRTHPGRAKHDGLVERRHRAGLAYAFRLAGTSNGLVGTVERTGGLIRPNYVSGIHGGITMAQLAEIRAVPGVTLAAPLAAVGAVNWPSAFQVPLSSAGARILVYRIRSLITGQAGLSHYPVEKRYVVIAPKGRLEFESGLLTVPGHAGPILCSYPVNCFAGTVCFGGHCSHGQYPSSSDASYYLPLLQPVQVAGIDPRAEAKLTGLRRCLRAGRLLSGRDRPTPAEDPEPAEVLPVMASDEAFLDQVLHVDVAAAAIGAHDEPRSLRGWKHVERRQVSLQSLYRRYLATSIHDYLDQWPIWSAGDVRYRTIGPDHLAAQPVVHDGIYRRVNTFQEVGIDDSVLIPPEVADPWLRYVTEHADTQPPGEGAPYRSKIWDVVGRYDPSCLPGFNTLAGATLEAYAAPDVRLSDGRRITPSRAMSDYVASPPLLLTTLAGARWLADPSRYEGQPGNAFISVIRVRVADTSTPGQALQARLAAAAAAIQDRTGLQVDIVKGASTRTISVDLPRGRFGRPALTVEEQWSAKGVALTFFQAVQDQDRALLALLLIDACLLVGQASYLAIHQRRSQLAVLRAHGWSPLQLACLVELETLIIGLAAGLTALLVALPILHLLQIPIVAATWAPPLGVGIAGLAALPAARTASRGSAVAAMAGVHPVRESRPPSTAAGLAARELRRTWPIETAIAVLAVASGTALVGLVVLVAAGFRSQLDTTVLGTALNTQVRPFQVVLAGLTLALGSAAAAQVVLLAWLSRRHQLGVLKALGWSGRRLGSLVCCQALILGSGGAALASPVVVAGAELLDAPAGSVVLALAATIAGCLAATMVAAVGPGLLALRVPARTLLEAP